MNPFPVLIIGFAAALFIAVSLSGCGGSQDTTYYKTHESERVDILAKCNLDPAHLTYSAECINARAAADQLQHENTFSTKNKGVPRI